MLRALGLLASIALAGACAADIPSEDDDATPAATPTVTATVLPGPVVTQSITVTPVPTPPATLEPGQGLVVGGPVVLRTAPTSDSAPSGQASDATVVTIVGEERGENWIVGNQTWPMAIQDWGNLWYRLDNGSYIYSAFVFVPQDGEASPLRYRTAANRNIVVDLASQTAYAMVGDAVVRQMAVTTGKLRFETPAGEHRVLGDGRIALERMTAQQAGFDENVRYDVNRVLFTQYFATGGYALHLNYWQPYSVFGRTATSHGCVGLLIRDAQFLWLFADPRTPVVVR